MKRHLLVESRNIMNDNGQTREQLFAEIAQLNQRVVELEYAEQGLRASEERIRLLVEHTPAAVAMLDRDMRYIMASQRWITDYELSDENIIGRSHYDIFPDIPDQWKAIHQRSLAGSIEGQNEDPWERADGGMDWLSWKTYPWHDSSGAIGGIIFFTEVVTKYVQDQQTMRESEVQLREINTHQEQLLNMIREISSPVIPVHDEVLVLPLVGTIDSARSSRIMETLLTGVQEHAAEVVIIDITGVPIVDTAVANHLIQATRAATLLGAHCVLVGVSAEVAQTLVQLGVNLSTLVTCSNLQAGITYALARQGRAITTQARQLNGKSSLTARLISQN
jgi:rsbT co-antagonist protein RsbR